MERLEKREGEEVAKLGGESESRQDGGKALNQGRDRRRGRRRRRMEV